MLNRVNNPELASVNRGLVASLLNGITAYLS
jgi:hypothetical protein